MRILILGVTGMLGNAIFRLLSQSQNLVVFGTARSSAASKYFAAEMAERLIVGIDVENTDSLLHLFSAVRPHWVINCIGLVKQLSVSQDPLKAIPINALLPHRLSRLSELVNARLIHISTDCVFSGEKGNYKETDLCDAIDLYGRSKALGEVVYSNSVTLRTSIIGHELQSKNGLVEWFLSQKELVKGFTKAIFSGLPTIELATVIRDYILPNKDLTGLFHVAADPIAKSDLLELIALIYGKSIRIEPDDNLVINRSLNADRFQLATNYVAPSWLELINRMHQFR